MKGAFGNEGALLFLTINFAAMANGLDGDNKHGVRDSVDDAIIADTNSVGIVAIDQFMATARSRIVSQCFNDSKHACLNRWIEPSEILFRRATELNEIPRHSFSVCASLPREEWSVRSFFERLPRDRAGLRASFRILRSEE